MANYSLVSDYSMFDPMTFEQMAKPLELYKQEYDKIQEGLGELDTKASIWENMADPERDPIAYARYKTYSNNLREQADSLALNGMSPSSKSALLGLKADYSNRITPIETAFAKRAELEEKQREERKQDPSKFFEREVANMSLDDFIRNPNLNYGMVASGKDITDYVKGALNHVSDKILAAPNKEVRDALLAGSNLLGYRYIWDKEGFSKKDIMNAFATKGYSDPFIRSIIDEALNAQGIGLMDEQGNFIGDGWGDHVNNARQLGLSAALKGLPYGVGTMELKPYQIPSQLYKNNSGSGDTPAPVEDAVMPTHNINTADLYAQEMADDGFLGLSPSRYENFFKKGILGNVITGYNTITANGPYTGGSTSVETPISEDIELFNKDAKGNFTTVKNSAEIEKELDKIRKRQPRKKGFYDSVFKRNGQYEEEFNKETNDLIQHYQNEYRAFLDYLERKMDIIADEDGNLWKNGKKVKVEDLQVPLVEEDVKKGKDATRDMGLWEYKSTTIKPSDLAKYVANGKIYEITGINAKTGKLGLGKTKDVKEVLNKDNDNSVFMSVTMAADDPKLIISQDGGYANYAFDLRDIDNGLEQAFKDIHSNYKFCVDKINRLVKLGRIDERTKESLLKETARIMKTHMASELNTRISGRLKGYDSDTKADTKQEREAFAYSVEQLKQKLDQYK